MAGLRALIISVLVGWAEVADAQARPAPAVEGLAGWGAFVDESLVDHFAIGGAARVHLSPRVSFGPEVTYMLGPGNDRDLFVLGNMIVELGALQQGRPARVSPFVIVGAGLFRHSNRFGSSTVTSNSGTFIGGAGVRAFVTDRVYVAPDVRIAVEDLHLRLIVTVGVKL
jgi:hypothetical protein